MHYLIVRLADTGDEMDINAGKKNKRMMFDEVGSCAFVHCLKS